MGSRVDARRVAQIGSMSWRKFSDAGPDEIQDTLGDGGANRISDDEEERRSSNVE
jgi:hypothetical protein